MQQNDDARGNFGQENQTRVLDLANTVGKGGDEGEGGLVHDGGKDEKLGKHGHVGLEKFLGKDDLRIAVQDWDTGNCVDAVSGGWRLGVEWVRLRLRMRRDGQACQCRGNYDASMNLSLYSWSAPILGKQRGGQAVRLARATHKQEGGEEERREGAEEREGKCDREGKYLTARRIDARVEPSAKHSR